MGLDVYLSPPLPQLRPHPVPTLTHPSPTSHLLPFRLLPPQIFQPTTECSPTSASASTSSTSPVSAPSSSLAVVHTSTASRAESLPLPSSPRSRQNLRPPKMW
ncbi:hypothetical protein K440DRAFT_630183 [Wilcoxina mikolae CBS 423.85]|nr:hypothetical protein K440DRAFT_630183 [Wilcoxina mikolae CBS 423.85]